MIESKSVEDFLTHHRYAVVGASDDPKNFGRTICREMSNRGYDVVPVHPQAAAVDGMPCFADLASVPGDLDGVIVMVPAQRSAEVVQSAVENGVPGEVATCRQRGVAPGSSPVAVVDRRYAPAAPARKDATAVPTMPLRSGTSYCSFCRYVVAGTAAPVGPVTVRSSAATASGRLPST